MSTGINVVGVEFKGRCEFATCRHSTDCGFYDAVQSGILHERMRVYKETYCQGDSNSCVKTTCPALIKNRYMLPNGRMYNPFTGKSICAQSFGQAHVEELERLEKERHGK